MNPDFIEQVLAGLITYFMYNNNLTELEASAEMLSELQDMGYVLSLEHSENNFKLILKKDENDKD